MKHLLYFSFLTVVFTACTNSSTTANPKNEASADTTSTQPLTEPTTVPTGLKLIPFKLSDKNCDLVGTEDFPLDEGWCNQRDVTGLRVSLTNSVVANKINGLICKEITGKIGTFQSIKNFVAQIKNLSNEEGEMEFIQDEYTCSLIDSTNTYLSMGIGSYFYAMGGAHPNYGIQVLNVDLNTGQAITLDDILSPGYLPSFKALAKRKFIAQNGNDTWWFSMGEQPFELSEVFSITRKGLTFHYQPYEMGPYAAGAPELVLSTADIAKWLKDNPYLKP